MIILQLVVDGDTGVSSDGSYNGFVNDVGEGTYTVQSLRQTLPVSSV